ncbi:translocation complex component protein [Rutstroemia sp. NJR-2017a BBW]|nr:translocation complex component protein [Rutstroemia sp. NJR-2017a BBW]
MTYQDLNYEDLTNTLIENFNHLADEVQLLSDRKTILEHKLIFCHNQYQILADKYADPDIASTLAKLQLPPDLEVTTPDRNGLVPLPPRKQPTSKYQTAVAIRDGRRAAQRLAAMTGRSTGSTTSKSISGGSSNMRLSARRTSLSTVLEQDFTVPGKKSALSCPFVTMSEAPQDAKKADSQDTSARESDRHLTPLDTKDRTPHHSADPICAQMYAETMSSPPPSATGSAAKCPIRYLDQHSPEEIARYFETHKHEIPRSHEICVKRYQRNEDDIRMLDAKYGNLVSMIQGLGQKHQPMLPSKEEEEAYEVGRASNERVENWAKAVSPEETEPVHSTQSAPADDRENRFDRTLKEIRVGESPSRPWGISVPIFDQPSERPVSPPPAPVSVPLESFQAKPTGCPFGQMAPSKAATNDEALPPGPPQATQVEASRPAGRCPFGHDQPKAQAPPSTHFEEQHAPSVVHSSQPAFIQPNTLPRNGNGPQMVFTGPVFIGYPIEQAVAFMKQYQAQNE